MGFRFRKSFGAGPFRVNLSKSGIGFSAGVKGFRVTKKAGGGTRTTASVPGTGIAYVKDSKKMKKKTPARASHPASSPGRSSSGGLAAAAAVGLQLLAIVFMAWVFVKMLPQPRSIWIAISILLALPVPAMQTWITKVFRIKGFWKAALCAACFLFGGLVHNNTIHVLVMAALAVASAILFKRWQAAQEDVAIEPLLPKPADQQLSEIQEKMKWKEEAFEAELNSIPSVDIPISEPAQKHLLKDLPPYDFSNITRTTRIDSIFPLVFLDVETTGFAPSKEDIVEVSAIKFDRGMVPVSCFTTLCKPRKPIPAAASDVNHITDDMVADAPEFRQIAPALTEFLRGCHLCGHNLDFDLRFIFAHGAEIPTGVRFYDTLDLAQLTIKKSDIDNYKLETLCSYYGVLRGSAHRSLSDCLATAKVFTYIVKDKASMCLDDVSKLTR